MDVLDEFRHEARASSGWLESIVHGVTPEQAAWHPPGRANTIASTYAHIVRNFDEDINEHFFERPLLSDGPWQGRTGLPASGPVEWEHGVVIDWLALREYGRAMCALTVEWVNALTEADLERKVVMGSTPQLASWRGIEVVRLTAGRHVWMHGGEIACLKGLQGLDGYVGFQTRTA
jgi:hypothetical protein